jgi:hypothetical protein
MKDELQNYMGRPKRYENIDGTGEMFMGLMMLGFALTSYLEAGLPENSSRWMHGVVVYSVLIPVLGLGFWVRRVIKKHITWPRTGYVAYPRDRKSWWTAIVAASIGAAGVAVGFAYLLLFARRHGAISFPRIFMLAALGAPYAFWVFYMSREHWWKWLVLLFMALGLVAITLIVPGGFNELGWPPILFVGLVWLGSGGATLFSYMQHTKPPAPEAE